MILKALIIDDDAGMRSVLRKIINSIDEVECIGEAEDGAKGVRLCLELKPDIVFIDVEMPVDRNGSSSHHNRIPAKHKAGFLHGTQ